MLCDSEGSCFKNLVSFDIGTSTEQSGLSNQQCHADSYRCLCRMCVVAVRPWIDDVRAGFVPWPCGCCAERDRGTHRPN